MGGDCDARVDRDVEGILTALREEWEGRLGGRDRGVAYVPENDTPISLALARLLRAGEDKRCECGDAGNPACMHDDECRAWRAAKRELGENGR